jgi:hypothetical protein
MIWADSGWSMFAYCSRECQLGKVCFPSVIKTMALTGLLLAEEAHREGIDLLQTAGCAYARNSCGGQDDPAVSPAS